MYDKLYSYNKIIFMFFMKLIITMMKAYDFMIVNYFNLLLWLSIVNVIVASSFSQKDSNNKNIDKYNIMIYYLYTILKNHPFI